MLEDSMKLDKDRIFLWIAVAITAISAVYWVSFSINAYNTFHEYSDAGIAAYSMYWHVHYANLIGGLEYLVFWDHIEITQLLVLPFFYLYQSMLTLLVFQDLVTCFTGLIVFFIVRDLIKSSSWGLWFCIAFLINPGVHGIMVYDYHAELFIIPFLLLTFYFYMKMNKKLFYLFLLLLLCSIEIVPLLGITLGIALFLYDYRHTKEKATRSTRLRMAAAAVIISILALLAYQVAIQILSTSYSTSYLGIPPDFKVLNFLSTPTGTLASLPHHIEFLPFYGEYALLTGLLFLGILVFFDPIVFGVLASVWLIEAFYLEGSPEFFQTVWYHYFSYIIGGTIIAAILGLMLMKQKKGMFAEFIYRTAKDYRLNFNDTTVRYTIIIFTAIIVFLMPFAVINKNASSLSEDFLLSINTSDQISYSHLDWAINQVPANASLMTEYFISPHVFSRQDMEIMTRQQFFVPDYVIADLAIDYNRTYPSFNDYNITQSFLTNSSYYVYAVNGSVIILKHK